MLSKNGLRLYPFVLTGANAPYSSDDDINLPIWKQTKSKRRSSIFKENVQKEEFHDEEEPVFE